LECIVVLFWEMQNGFATKTFAQNWQSEVMIMSALTDGRIGFGLSHVWNISPSSHDDVLRQYRITFDVILSSRSNFL
jgi:hypothetical protein